MSKKTIKKKILKTPFELVALKIKSGEDYSEIQITELIDKIIVPLELPELTDGVSVRRTLVDLGFMKRDQGGNVYRKISNTAKKTISRPVIKHEEKAEGWNGVAEIYADGTDNIPDWYID